MSNKQFGVVLMGLPIIASTEGIVHYTVAVYDFNSKQVRIITDPIYIPLAGEIPDVVSFVDYIEKFNLIRVRKFVDLPENELSEQELEAANIILGFLQREKDNLSQEFKYVDFPVVIEFLKSYIEMYVEAHKSGEVYRLLAERIQNVYDERNRAIEVK